MQFCSEVHPISSEELFKRNNFEKEISVGMKRTSETTLWDVHCDKDKILWNVLWKWIIRNCDIWNLRKQRPNTKQSTTKGYTLRLFEELVNELRSKTK